MKKYLFYLMLTMIVILGACSNDDAEQTASSESEEVDEQMQESESAEEEQDNNGDGEAVEVDERFLAIQEKGEVEEYGGLVVTNIDMNQVLYSDADIEVRLVSLEHSVDLIFESESYNFHFEFDNGLDDTLFVKIYDITIDGVVLEGVSQYTYMEESIPLNFENYEHSVSATVPDGELPILGDSIDIPLQIKDPSYEEIFHDVVTVEF